MDNTIEKNDSQNDNKEDLEQPEIINSSLISDDEDANFLFFYNLAKKMVLNRHEIGGKQSFKYNSLIHLF